MNTLQKTALNLDEKEKLKILETDTFRPLSIKFILERVKDRGNSSTHYRKPPTQSIQQQKHTSKLDKK